LSDLNTTKNSPLVKRKEGAFEDYSISGQNWDAEKRTSQETSFFIL